MEELPAEWSPQSVEDTMRDRSSDWQLVEKPDREWVEDGFTP